MDSTTAALTDYGVGVVCFANLTYAPTATLNLNILDTLVKMAGLEKRVIPPSAILEQRKNELIQLLPEWNGLNDHKVFAENFFLDNNVEFLRKEASQLFAKAGLIIRVHDLVAENNLRGSFILEGEHASLQVSFTLTPENPPVIQEYHIREIRK